MICYLFSTTSKSRPLSLGSFFASVCILYHKKTIFAILFKKHSNKKYFEYYQTDKIKITSKSGIPWTIDGEFGGRKKQVEINNINMAIEYVIPM